MPNRTRVSSKKPKLIFKYGNFISDGSDSVIEKDPSLKSINNALTLSSAKSFFEKISKAFYVTTYNIKEGRPDIKENKKKTKRFRRTW